MRSVCSDAAGSAIKKTGSILPMNVVLGKMAATPPLPTTLRGKRRGSLSLGNGETIWFMLDSSLRVQYNILSSHEDLDIPFETSLRRTSFAQPDQDVSVPVQKPLH